MTPPLTPSELAGLRAKCDALAPFGCVTSRQVLALLDERDAAQRVVDSLAERVYKQSELLSRRAEGKQG